MIRQQQLRFLGHIIRHERLESMGVMSKVEGRIRRRKGRPRIKHVDTLARVFGVGTCSAQLLYMTDRRHD